MVDRWNRLDQEDIDSETINGSKSEIEIPQKLEGLGHSVVKVA